MLGAWSTTRKSRIFPLPFVIITVSRQVHVDFDDINFESMCYFRLHAIHAMSLVRSRAISQPREGHDFPSLSGAVKLGGGGGGVQEMKILLIINHCSSYME